MIHVFNIGVRDVVQLAPGRQLFAGLRHTRLTRQSERTIPSSDSLGNPPFEQSVTAPWLALTQSLAPGTIAYVSWGRGLEADVAPSRARYTNAGATFSLPSRQFELGVKHESQQFDTALAVFDIDRPQTTDVGACGAAQTCTRVIDGSARHRGLEAAGALRAGAWQWQASAMWLDAQRQGSSKAGVNGSTPANVPRATLRLGSEWAMDAVPGLSLLAQLAAESERHLVPAERYVFPSDANATIAGWSRLDLGARWRHTLDGSTLIWRLAVDNATDRRAWKESPYQFSHVYLYPLAPRTWRASVQASF